ncbi:MAG: hypothetical protein OEY49_11745 [Candidatus Heimdallarchaeota archaeon]|nr:hypothetical protein [Candidatus Heimdallarchaeota archaeon]
MSISHGVSTNESTLIESVDKIHLREIILIVLGLVEKPLSSNILFTLVQNFIIRLPKDKRVTLPPNELYSNIVTRLVQNNSIIMGINNTECLVTLTERGHGEFDLINFQYTKDYKLYNSIMKFIDLIYLL